MENKKLNTPTGTASYPHLTTPDSFMGAESYKCNLIIDASETDFRSKVDAFVAASRKEALDAAEETLAALDPEAKSPKAKKAYEAAEALVNTIKDDEKYRTPLTEEWGDDDKPTGNWVLVTKSKASFKDHKSGEMISLAPKFFDAKAALMEDRPLIKGGSRLNLGITLVAYSAGGAIGAGVTCRINAVQIIKLSGGSSTGFESQDSAGSDSEGFSPQESGVY